MINSFLFLFAALIMLRGGNMRFRPATVFSFVSYLPQISYKWSQSKAKSLVFPAVKK